jgi:hypothetical protein
MNCRAKGNRNRLRAIKYLESIGFLVGVVERTGRFIKDKDLFGLFDLCCINNKGRVLFVQVKSNYRGKYVVYQEFSRDYKIDCMIMNFIDYKDVKVINYCSGFVV